MLIVFASSAVTFISFWVCIVSIYERKTYKSVYFSLLSLAVFFYMLGNFFELTSMSVDAAMIGIKIAYLGTPFIPPLWYLCVREYCGRKVEDFYTVCMIMLMPCAIMIMAFTSTFNDFLFSDVQYHTGSTSSQLSFSKGFLYKIHEIYLYVFNILGFYTIFSSYLKGTPRFRKQVVFFFFSALIPIFNTERYIVNVGDYWFDITTYGLSLSMLMFFISIRKYGIENSSSIIKDSVVENMSEGILLFDKDGIYMDANKKMKSLFPQVETVRMGTHLDAMDFLPVETSMLLEKGGQAIREIKAQDDKGVEIYNISVSELRNKKNIIGYSVIFYNLTAFKTVMTDLESKAHKDPLTDIYNRRFLFEKLEHECDLARLTGSPLSIILFDLDFFKKINDTYGHSSGDYVLKTVAAVCSGNLRKTDIFGRYGGEEFCIVLPGTDAEGARRKAENIRLKISNYHFFHEDNPIKVTASFGIAEIDCEKECETSVQLIKFADICLYQAKADGRNRVV